MAIKKQQHYVWENYLNAWKYNEKHLFCFRKKNNKIFPSSPNDVGKQDRFYKIDSLSELELKFLEDAFIKSITNEHMKEAANGWVNVFKMVFAMFQFAEGKESPRIKEGIHEIMNNFMEDIHTKIELQAIPLLKELQLGRTAFFDNEENMSDFMLFLCMQYFRTNKLKQNYLKVVAEISEKLPNEWSNIDLSKIWNILTVVFATNMGATLYALRENYDWCIINNSTETPFITIDQPVVNLKGNYELEQSTEELELFYPLSPKLALLISEKKNGNSNKIDITNSEYIEMYNERLLIIAEEQVYSNSKQYMEEIKIKYSKINCNG